MNKLFKFTLIIVVFFASTKVAFADASLSVKISSPKTPTNQTNFNVTFGVLDVQQRLVTVRCFKKGPIDSSFSQFGSDHNFTAGGSDKCVVDDKIVNHEGAYQFYVEAIAGNDTVDSQTISVNYSNTNPGTPSGYSKTPTETCNYQITFKTADDDGRTTKVEIYRSDKQSFSADSSSIIDTISIGSNQDVEYNTSVPDCGKTYYFAVQAFNSAGNGSALVGDSFTNTDVVNDTSSSSDPVSIQVTNPEGKNSSSSSSNSNSFSSGILGQVEGASTTAWWRSRKVQIILVLALIGAIGYGLRKKFRFG